MATPARTKRRRCLKRFITSTARLLKTRDFVEFEMVSSLDLANARAPNAACHAKPLPVEIQGQRNAVTREQQTLRQLAQTLLHQLQLITPTLLVRTFCQLETALRTVEKLISSNGWLDGKNARLMGTLLLYTKPAPSSDYYATLGDNRPFVLSRAMYLRMQNDGNLVIYNKASCATTTSGGSVVFGTHVNTMPEH